MSFSATYLIYLHHAILPALSHYLSVALHRLILFYLASMYTRKSRAGHSNNAHSSVSMSSSTKGVQSRTRLVDCNLGWRGPIISESELAKLGTEVELLRVRHSCQLPCFALPCFAQLSLALLCFVLLCFALLCCALLCYALLRLILCHVILCSSWLHQSSQVLLAPHPPLLCRLHHLEFLSPTSARVKILIKPSSLSLQPSPGIIRNSPSQSLGKQQAVTGT